MAVPTEAARPTPSLMPVATFWAGEALPALDRACLASFARLGHAVTVYSFEEIPGLPDGVQRADAALVAPRESMSAFLYGGRPNLSHFSDYFRYKLFAERGTAWIDTDLMLLRPLEDPGTGTLFGKETPTSLCGAIMRIDRADPRLRELLRRTEALMHTDLVWGATGPRLLNRVLGADAVMAQAQPPQRFFPVHWDDFYKPLLPEHAAECAALCAQAHTLHLWNNIVVGLGYWKELAPPVGSFLWQRLDALGLLDLFRDTYPEAVMRQMVTNWHYRKSGADIGILRLARQVLPSIGRTVTPRVRKLLQSRA